MYAEKLAPGRYAVDIYHDAVRSRWIFRTERDAERFANAARYAIDDPQSLERAQAERENAHDR